MLQKSCKSDQKDTKNAKIGKKLQIIGQVLKIAKSCKKMQKDAKRYKKMQKDSK